jgi:ribulose bisphosphate carboxylase small subunit
MSYYIAPRFLDKISIHITKNYLDLPGVKVPLILGIHGRKGEGKSFQCELAFERMNVEVVHMSAGELESPDAGDPARLIRLRYREAAEFTKVRGKMAVLMINDIDAGMGRVDQFTQYTVNTQLVAGTLMNIADNPTNVQLPGSYDAEPIQRIPIIVTGNDFSTLYAPLVRDGRMEKFYWEPDRDDRIGIVCGIFEQDALSRRDIEQLVDTFPDQSIDFYSALHSRLYDEQVRQFIQAVGIERISQRVVNSAEKPPEFRKPDFSLSHLIEMGHLMVREQQRIQELRLIREYNAPADGRSTREYRGNGAEKQTAKHEGAQPPSPYPHSSISPQPRVADTPSSTSEYSDRSTNQRNGQSTPSDVPAEAQQTLRDLLNQGYRVGIEYVDERRFRTNSWQGYAVVQGPLSAAMETLRSCFNEHEQDYIRLVGIDSNRRRVLEQIIQRPRSKAGR